MTTVVDTNVIVALWDRDETLRSAAQSALDLALTRGSLVVAAPVFAELLAAPGRDESFVDSFFQNTGIAVDWELEEGVWRAAGRAFRAYAGRRKRQRDPAPRRILASIALFMSGWLSPEPGRSTKARARSTGPGTTASC